MDISTLREKLLFNRESKLNNISLFNEMKRNSNLRKNVSEMYPFIESSNISQLLFHLRDNLPEELCICGKPRRFIKFDKGYFSTCGDKICVNTVRLNSIKKTTQEKYGVDHTSQLPSVKETTKKTMIERYDCEHSFSGKIREKTYEKNFKKWGVKHALQRKESQEKRSITLLSSHGTLNMLGLEKTKKTNKEKYGVENAMKSIEISNKVSESLKRTFTKRQIYKLLSHEITLINYEATSQYYKILCNRCQTVSNVAGASMNSKIRANVSPCTICNPYIPSYVSHLETEVKLWIESLGVKVQNSVKTICKNRELDIYLPDLRIGFEFNGLYWHDERKKDEKYHFNKSHDFLMKGIRIFHIWEDDWNQKKNIVKKRILNLLNKTEKTGARNCIIKEISYREAKFFLDDNHIDGNFPAKIYIGAYFHNNLVSVMSFSKARFSSSNEWEIIRFSSSMKIHGIASKFFKFFIQQYSPHSVISFAKIDWTPDPNDCVYTKIGLTLESTTPPSPYWNIDGSRVHRLNFTKKKIETTENKHMTAVEIMHSKGFYRVWDCGNWKFSWKS